MGMGTTAPVVSERGEMAESALSELARRKLEAFARIEHDFMASFRFVSQVHGLRRFTAFPVDYIVRYLHSLVTCERKDLLLSVPYTGQRYEGARCLELLRDWQEGHSAGVVTFIHRKLDGQPFAELTASIDAAEREGPLAAARSATLIVGRAVLLNRFFTLGNALDAIFTLDPQRLRAEVREACKRMGYTPDGIERLLAEMRTDLYTRAPHPELARRNMLLMNHVGALCLDMGHKTAPELPLAPHAAITIRGEATQLSLNWRSWS
jgi:hypothetical protein